MSTVLITGTSSGFGRLTARELAARGHHVFAGMRDVERRNATAAQELTAWAADAGHQLSVVGLDVSSQDHVDRAVEEVVGAAGRLDVLVNNAGQGQFGLAETFTDAQLAALLDLNVLGPLRTIRAALPHMRGQRDGLLVQVSSLIGRYVMPFMTPYAATKHAVEALAEGFGYELSGLGVQSVIVEPFSMATAGSLTKIVHGEDSARAAGYGGLDARQAHMFDQNNQWLAGEQGPDPQSVAAAIADLIELPAADRPLRTTVGPNAEGAEVLNRTSAAVQGELLQALGLGDLLPGAARG
jgi:NAD(P)-dependent dehydrogenase (short-subunit alcohol dehydrogenase family)